MDTDKRGIERDHPTGSIKLKVKENRDTELESAFEKKGIAIQP